MDAERYQRIQAIFQSVADLEPDRWEESLQAATEGDAQLLAEVRSLLREHNAAAAQREGRLVQPTASLFDGKSVNDDDSTSGAMARLTSPAEAELFTTAATRPSPTAQPTLHASLRTHAVPRHSPQRDARPERPHVKPQTLTSIGPPAAGGKQWRTWAALALPLLVPIWFAAVLIHQRDRANWQVVMTHQQQLIIDTIVTDVDAALHRDRPLAKQLVRSPELAVTIQQQISGGEDKPDAGGHVAKSLQTIMTEAMSEVEIDPSAPIAWAWWDRELTLRGLGRPGEPEGDPPEQRSLVAPEGAATLTRAFSGQITLFGPAPASDLFGDLADVPDATLLGWVAPVAVGADGPVPRAVVWVSRPESFNVVSRVLEAASKLYDADVYLVDRSGTRRSATRAMGRSPSPPATLRRELSALDLTLVVEPGQAWMAKQLPPPVWPWATAMSGLVTLVTGVAAWRFSGELKAATSARQPLGNYAIGEELGSGGMGHVYRALHRELGREIAIKILRSDRQDADDQQRFDREAKLAATLTSPHSVTIYDYGRSDEGDAFCVMQLLDGLTLQEVIARSGHQPTARVVWILRQICQSIQEAHAKGLMHRDLKPQNVMLDYDALIGDWAVVFDFGLAKPLQPDPGVFQTAETIWAGTPMYMAPERFREPSVLDPRSDLYSIGCIAYTLLAGHPPFSECDPQSMFALILSESPISLTIHRGEPVDERLDALVRRCMAKNKTERYPSIASLIEALDELLEQSPWTRQASLVWWQTHAPEIL